MPIKNLLNRFQPVQLYTVLVLSICYFAVQLVFSHITHALTLLMASYHMLCNIFALTGCIVTIKHSKRKSDYNRELSSSLDPNGGSHLDINNEKVIGNMTSSKQSIEKRERREMKLRNTFGWARIDILTMLMVCIILASLSFSLIVEAIQTLIHIDHQDTMHLPLPVMILGFVGMTLNGLTYLLIGGYTMHQGSFLHVTPDGDVVLDRAMSNSGDLALKPDERQLSKTRNDQQLKEDLKREIGQVHYAAKRQGSVEMLRDVSSTIFVIVCALIVYMAEDEQHTAKFIDPILSIFSCVLLVSLSYPYMKESCLILLQTIPGSIDMENFENTLITKFPEIVSYHDLHIWQLSAHKYVATVHIKFKNPKLYSKIIGEVRSYFNNEGITEITIQPEFHGEKTMPSLECLVQCNVDECADKVCCKDSRADLREVSIVRNGGGGDENSSGVPVVEAKPVAYTINNFVKQVEETKSEQKTEGETATASECKTEDIPNAEIKETITPPLTPISIATFTIDEHLERKTPPSSTSIPAPKTASEKCNETKTLRSTSTLEITDCCTETTPTPSSTATAQETPT